MRVREWRTHRTANAENESTPVVLVHGGFVDGSGREDGYHALRKDGFPVSVVQHATATLADDVAATRRVLDAQSGCVILIGQSHGGVVISEAGTHPKVAALVYIAAFAPDAGESVSKPSWYLFAIEGRMVPPPARRLMSKRVGATVVQVAASHSSTYRRRAPLPT